MASPQKENGNTQIANEIIEALIGSGINGTEWSVVMLIIRKTYGWQKKQDQISLTQFLDNIPVSKWALCKALKKLQLVNIIRLVNKGNSKNNSNVYSFNKDYDSWSLVNKSRLVNKTTSTSQQNYSPTSQQKLTHKRNYTKENNKKKENFLNEKDFQLIWSSYPDKSGDKKRSLQKFIKAKHTKELLPKIFQAIEYQKNNPKFVGYKMPMAATWINAERWNDELPDKTFDEYVKEYEKDEIAFRKKYKNTIDDYETFESKVMQAYYSDL